jgi:hypothetical protein
MNRLNLKARLARLEKQAGDPDDLLFGLDKLGGVLWFSEQVLSGPMKAMMMDPETMGGNERRIRRYFRMAYTHDHMRDPIHRREENRREKHRYENLIREYPAMADEIVMAGAGGTWTRRDLYEQVRDFSRVDKVDGALRKFWGWPAPPEPYDPRWLLTIAEKWRLPPKFGAEKIEELCREWESQLAAYAKPLPPHEPIKADTPPAETQDVPSKRPWPWLETR